MKININLFHKRPLFSFRCDKKNKKIFKKRAKEERIDLEGYFLRTSDYYAEHKKGNICFNDFILKIDPNYPLKIKILSDPDFEYILHWDDYREGKLNKYLSLPIEDITITKMDDINNGVKNAHGICLLLNDIK